MVAITVILAAVIGAFVLEIGDQQETAPNTSFTTEEQTVFFQTPEDPAGYEDKANLTEVSFTHSGGDVIGLENFQIKTNGYPGAVGPKRGSEETYADANSYVPVVNHPNQVPAAGTNEQVGFTSGESMAVWGFGDRTGKEWLETRWAAYPGQPGAAEVQPLLAVGYGHLHNGEACYATLYDDNDDYSDEEGAFFPWEVKENNPRDGCVGTNTNYLLQNDELSVVWEASSGGKTQVLSRYTVQSSQPDGVN
jgi:hypothetical protein